MGLKLKSEWKEPIILGIAVVAIIAALYLTK